MYTERTNTLPSVAELESMAFESLQAIENPNEKLKQFHKLIRKRLMGRSDCADDFREFFISPKGVIEIFIQLLDSVPPSSYRDKIIMSVTDLLLDYAVICSCEDEGLERAESLFCQLETDEWKEQTSALIIKHQKECSWYSPLRTISNSQDIESLIQGVKQDFSGLKNPLLHCRLLAKLAVVMVEDHNIDFAVELAYRIEDTYRKFAALVNVAFHYQKAARDIKNQKSTSLVSLLKSAEQLLPEIPEECRKYDDYKKHLETIASLFGAVGYFDEMMVALDRIPALEDRLFRFTSIVNEMHRNGYSQEIPRVVRHYYDLTQSMNIVEKAKWICAIVEIRQCYEDSMNARQFVIELHEAIGRESDLVAQIMAMVQLGRCYTMLGDKSQALEIYHYAERKVKNISDANIGLPCRVEILAAMAKNEFWSDALQVFETTEDNGLLALAYARISNEFHVHYHNEADKNPLPTVENYRSMIGRIFQAASTLNNPVDKATVYCELAATKDFYDSLVDWQMKKNDPARN